MYQVKVNVILEDGTVKEKTFNFWGEAGAWVEYLAEMEIIPATIKMQIIR